MSNEHIILTFAALLLGFSTYVSIKRFIIIRDAINDSLAKFKKVQDNAYLTYCNITSAPVTRSKFTLNHLGWELEKRKRLRLVRLNEVIEQGTPSVII